MIHIVIFLSSRRDCMKERFEWGGARALEGSEETKAPPMLCLLRAFNAPGVG